MRTVTFGAYLAALASACAPSPRVAREETAPVVLRHDPGDLFAALKARDPARVRALVVGDPSLAAARSPRGSSALLVAAFTLNDDEETFVKPRDNAMLRALLEARPRLDVFDAAVAGDVARLGELLATDPRLANARHPSGGAPLHLAAFADRAEAVELLLARGAELDALAANEFHNTPLVLATLGDAKDAARVLLERGAKTEIPEEGGLRALHIAAEVGDPALVQLLLDHGARVDARAEDGTTPLGVAMKKSRAAVAELLRSHGAT